MFNAISDTPDLRTIYLILFISAVILGFIYSQKYGLIAKWLSQLGTYVKTMLNAIKDGDESMEEALESAGYAYDPKQDIFYSTMDAWQRNFGYCRLYDEAAAPLNMIIDCEPVYFDYDRKKWMIELWKGQYAMTTGGEIGVYTSIRPKLNIPGIFQGTFFDCASDEDLLPMSFVLKKKGKTFFTRVDKHWWLTGFVLAEFSEPWELTMDIRIDLKDKTMGKAFVQGLIEAGYSKDEICISGNTVSLVFDEPRTPQPFTRTPATDWIIQRKNEWLCIEFNNLTQSFSTTSEKIKAMENHAEMYAHILNIGKHKHVYELFHTIKKHLK